jgi:predicted dehydrogenase
MVTSVCDIFRPHLETAVAKTEAKAASDYRQILDDDEIDGVIITTPDHWHARMAIDSAQAGKDVYLEAPMTRTWEEAVELHDAVAKNKVVFQCGAQLCSDDRYHQAKQIVANGGIGQLLYVQASVNRNSRVGFYNRRIWSDVSPKSLDWKAWLGPAPSVDLNADRFVRWRKYWDYSGGVATNLLFNAIASQLIAVGTQIPKRVSSGGGVYLEASSETPDTYFTTMDFDKFSCQITSCLGNEQPTPLAIYGHEGTIRIENTLNVVRERYFANEFKEREEKGLLNVVQTVRPDHVRNWLECLRSREKPVCHEGVAQAAMIAAHLGELSYRQSKTMLFDPEKRQLKA